MIVFTSIIRLTIGFQFKNGDLLVVQVYVLVVPSTYLITVITGGSHNLQVKLVSYIYLNFTIIMYVCMSHPSLPFVPLGGKH